MKAQGTIAVPEIVSLFHQLYYGAASGGGTWTSTSWLGVPVLKCPLDLWVYQEILFEQRPDLIVETGTARGGSALFLASLCDLIGHGRVVTIDIQPDPTRPRHARVTQIVGSSTDEGLFAAVRDLARASGRVLVILDSDHSRDHVLRELELYGSLVTPGSYLIVEDTNVNGNPVLPQFGPGPMEAVSEFLARNDHFAVDSAREKFFLTFNPGGYLKRVR
jgi:cephalosporin hydroxylase